MPLVINKCAALLVCFHRTASGHVFPFHPLHPHPQFNMFSQSLRDLFPPIPQRAFSAATVPFCGGSSPPCAVSLSSPSLHFPSRPALPLSSCVQQIQLGLPASSPPTSSPLKCSFRVLTASCFPIVSKGRDVGEPSPE